MNKKAIIGGLLCAVGLMGIFGFSTGSAFDFFGGSKIDLPLQSIYFSRGGDMQGSHHVLSVRGIDDKAALVCYEDAKWHNVVIQVQEYLVPQKVLEDIKTIFNANNLAKCAKAPQSKMFALDAATKSYSFEFEKKRISFSSNQELTRENYDALRQISACVSEACKNGERIPALYFEKNAEGNMPLRNAVQKGKFTIRVVCYRNNTLEIAISNALDEAKELSLQAKIIELGKPELVVAERLTDEKDKISQHENTNNYWKLAKPLEAGKYRLSLGEYHTEFEIR